MNIFRFFSLLFFSLLIVLPVYASGPVQDKSTEPTVAVTTVLQEKENNTIPLRDSVPQTPEDKNVTPIFGVQMGKAPSISSYSSNEIAVKAVEKNIGLFRERIKERFSLWLSRSGKYLNIMQEILKKNNIPEDLVFLSLIESGFNPYAYSIARAVGPWQFIASTAKRYGLTVDWWRDERRDPVKSTEAAANYLKDLYEMFGSWNLAMAAYNAGEGKILKALKRSKSDDYWSLLKTKYIRNETKDYVPKFIAASLIASNPQDFGFENLEYHLPLDYAEVTVESPIDLDVVAKCVGTTVGEIRELNPELRRWSTPPDVPAYTLRIPAGKKELFLENLASIPEGQRFTVETYTVKRGDTLSMVARNAEVPVKAILVLNSMSTVKPLKVGTKLYLPPKEKFQLDRDDRVKVRKASLKSPEKKKAVKTMKLKNRKMLVTSLDKKKNVYND